MFAASKTASVSGGYQISRSLRFNTPDSTYLNRTPASNGNRRTYTWSFWIKKPRNAVDYEGIFSAGNGTDQIRWQNNDTLLISLNATSAALLITTQVFRDVSAWGHLVVAFDTTQATSSNRIKVYWNGVQITAFGTSTYPTQNYDCSFNSTSSQVIGRANDSSSYLSGYMTEVNFIDGQALTPSSFGETNAQTGVWQPKAYSGSYGTNGFKLNFSDNSNTTAATLGADSSGNGNNWTPNNFSVTAGAGNDSLVDSPTSYGLDTGVGGTVRGNYATFNPLSTSRTLSNGNLYTEVTGGGGSNIPISLTMALPNSGKWYWEITAGGASGGGNGGWDWGIVASSTPNFSLNNLIVVGTTGCYGVNGNDGNLRSNNTTAVAGYISGGITGGDVVQVAYDAGAGKLWLGKNNTWGSNGGAGNPAAGTNAGITGLSGEFIPVVEYASDAGLVSATLNSGQRPFAYTAPSGFKALCTQNLPTPTIGAATATQAGKYFNSVLYTGNGSARSITGVGFQPDWNWIKVRNDTSWHNLVDAVRGVTLNLASNNTNAEATASPTRVTSFDADGFSLGTSNDVNFSGNTFVAWNWKANGAGSSNTAGSITSTVSANTTSGFSIVTYTAVGGVSTVGHGLGVVPSMMIFKDRDGTANWPVYHISLGNTSACLLDTTAASSATANWWNNTSPTSSVVTIGSNENTSTRKYVAYCFAPVAGYSAFGSYTGNGSADGPFVFTGFRPAYLLVKRTDAVNYWFVFDSARDTSNAVDLLLDPNDSRAEISGALFFDFLSNGFKSRATDGGQNASGGTYIYMAFASNPFKYSLAQ